MNIRPDIIRMALFLFGGFFGFFLGRFWTDTTNVVLTNPHSEVKYSINKRTEEDDATKAVVQNYLHESANGHISSISVYFRAFGTGLWFGIGEDIPYAPASLLKVPLMIAYLKQAQVQPSILEEKIQYIGGEDKNEKEFTRTASSLEPGTYAVNELLERMIIHSGNNSSEALEERIDKIFYKEVYTDLGLSFKKSSQDIDFVSPKQMAVVFRVLYNASYLNRARSEYALEILSKTDFTEGLVAGVPEDTTVAHKFGERGYSIMHDKIISSVLEFHDCGLVYAPENPYILCIMTKGDSLDEQKKAIAKISGLVYRTVTE